MGKVYDLKELEKFHKNVFIVNRTECGEVLFGYDQVLKLVKDILEQFRSYNFSPNVGVALYLQGHTPCSIILLLSILSYKCYFIPLLSNELDSDLQAVLNAHGAKYVISDHSITKFRQVGCLRILDNIMYLYENKAWAVNSFVKENSFCYSIATSGSTGNAKVVQVPYSCVEPNITALSAILNVTDKDVIYLCAPLTFDPFIIELFLTIQNGAALLVTSPHLRSNPIQLKNILWPLSDGLEPHETQSKQRGATILQTTPSFFRLFGETAIREVILNSSSSLRSLILGGEDFPNRLEWNSWFSPSSSNKRIFNIYGITELSCWCTIHECSFDGDWQRVPIGVPLDSNTKIRIVDQDHNEIFGVCEGHLEVGSLTRKCYIPSIDRKSLSDKHGFCFRATGDIVHRDENGDVYYLGRLDSMIKRMGIRVNIEILEQTIQSLLNNEYNKVKCVWQKETHKITCFIEIDARSPNISLMHIRQLLMKNLKANDRPDEIKFISNFPINSHGKIDRRCLLTMLSDNTKLEPQDIFRKFLRETLGLNLSITDDDSTEGKKLNIESSLSFTAAGGTSLQAITLANEIDAMLAYNYERGELLAMLLNPQKSLSSIAEFLEMWLSKISFEHRTNVSPSLLNKTYTKIFKFLWSASLNKCVDSAPTIVDKKWICVGSHSHTLATLDCRLGSPIVALELPGRIECKVEVVPNRKYQHLAAVGCYDHHLYLYNYISGHIYWTIDVGGRIKAKPLSYKTRIAIASYGEEFNVLCVCWMTRKFIWRKKIGTKGIFANPIKVNGSAMIVCTLDGSFCKICLNSGHCLWSRKCKSPIFSTPVVKSEEGVIILAEVKGEVHICKTENGDLLNTFVTGSPIFCGLTEISTTKICFGCYDKNVYCLKYRNIADTSQQISFSLNITWKVQLDSNVFASPIAISLQRDEFVLSCSTKGLMVLLNAENGQMVAVHRFNEEVFSTPCYINNRIFIGCRDNNIYSFCIK